MKLPEKVKFLNRFVEVSPSGRRWIFGPFIRMRRFARDEWLIVPV